MTELPAPSAKLTQVDAELTLPGTALCSRQQVVGAGIGTETICIIVIIARDNLTLLFKKRKQEPSESGPSIGL